jgi:hypothetical protein
LCRSVLAIIQIGKNCVAHDKQPGTEANKEIPPITKGREEPECYGHEKAPEAQRIEPLMNADAGAPVSDPASSGLTSAH